MMTRLGELSVPDHMALLRLVNACPHHGRTVDTGRGCACPPTHVCERDWRIVDADDCLACAAASTTPPPVTGGG